MFGVVEIYPALIAIDNFAVYDHKHVNATIEGIVHSTCIGLV